VLSVARCRSLLGPDCTLTEARLDEVRQDLYTLAQISVEGFCKRRDPKDVTPAAHGSASQGAPLNVPTATSLLPNEDRHAVEERSAILEFEAGLSRQEAEREALLEWAGQHSTKRRPRRSKKRVIRSL
jgi:hypothetical protein